MDEYERFKRDYTSYAGVKLTMNSEEAKTFFESFHMCKNCHYEKAAHLGDRCLYGPGRWELDPVLSVSEET